MSAVSIERTLLHNVAHSAVGRSRSLMELRKRAALTGKQAADNGGVSATTVSHWETGKGWPANTGDLARYLTGLGLDRALIEEALNGDAGAAEEALRINSVNLAESLDALVASHTGDADLHELEGRMWQVGMPRIMAAMILKASTGEVPAARLATERRDLWVQSDASRIVGTATDVTPKATAWTQQALAPLPSADEALPVVADKGEECENPT